MKYLLVALCLLGTTAAFSEDKKVSDRKTSNELLESIKARVRILESQGDDSGPSNPFVPPFPPQGQFAQFEDSSELEVIFPPKQGPPTNGNGVEQVFDPFSSKKERRRARRQRRQQGNRKPAQNDLPDPEELPDPPFGPDPFPNEPPPSDPEDPGPIDPGIDPTENDSDEQEGEEIPDNVFNIPDPPFGEVERRATFDLASGTTPTYDGYKPNEVQLAALNLLLNSLSSHPKLVTVNPASINQGKVSIESFGSGRNNVPLGEIFNLGAIDDLLRDGGVKNPYQCAGDERFQFRLDWLMSTLMSDEVYSKMLDLPDNWRDLADRLGVDRTPPGQATTNPNKIWVEDSMISSSDNGRILEFQDQRGKTNRILLRSTDFPRTPKPGRESEFSDPTLHPNDYEGAAGEFIFNLPNGLFAYKLAGKDGKGQPEAPGSIVVNDSSLVGGDFPSNHNGSEISSPRDCMRCHRSGPIGQDYLGDWNIKEELAKRVKQRLISEREAKEAEERYTTAEKYSTRMKQVRKNYLKKLKDANAFLGDENGDMVPLMPDFEAVYRKELDFKQVAHELGLDEKDLTAALKEDGNESLRDRLGISMTDGKLKTKDFKIERTIFEKVFCEIKEGVVGEEPLQNQPVEGDEDAPLTNEPVHSQPSSGGTFR